MKGQNWRVQVACKAAIESTRDGEGKAVAEWIGAVIIVLH